MELQDNISESDFADLILRYAAEAHITLTPGQALLLSRHVRIMLEWNSRLNLTRITRPEEVIVKHLLDSIAPARYLPSSGHALDVGAGAGFPGIPLKILNPGLQMILLESSRKKASFLTSAAASLELTGILPLHGSWQDFRQDKGRRGKFELIVMRALRPEPEHISRLASSLLTPGGFFARWEVLGPDGGNTRVGAQKVEERQDVEFCGDFDYSLPGMTRRRVVRLWRKK